MSGCTAPARLLAANLLPLGAGDRDLHAAAERAHVADDDLVARLQAVGDLRNALLLGLCSAWQYDPARPVIWTRASLDRSVELYAPGRFYA